MLPDRPTLSPTAQPSSEERSIETVADRLRAALADADPDLDLERLVGAALGDEASTHADREGERGSVLV